MLSPPLPGLEDARAQNVFSVSVYILAAGCPIFQLRIKTALRKFAKLDNEALVLSEDFLKFKLYVGIYIFFQEECAGPEMKSYCVYTKIKTTLFSMGPTFLKEIGRYMVAKSFFHSCT